MKVRPRPSRSRLPGEVQSRPIRPLRETRTESTVLISPARLAPFLSRRRRGFSLIETACAIVATLLLAVVLVAVVWPKRNEELHYLSQVRLVHLRSALENFRKDLGSYPSLEHGGLRALLERPSSDAAKWNGPYIDTAIRLVDTWGTEFDYAPPQNAGDTPNAGSPYRLTSAGRDGVHGTDDDVDLAK